MTRRVLTNAQWAIIEPYLSSHAVSSQGKAVCVVNEPVEDGIGKGWVAYGFMPLIHGRLACEDGGSAALAIFENFQKIATFRCAQH